MAIAWPDLDVAQPINKNQPLNLNRTAWWLGIPQRAGGPAWYDLVQGRPATLSGFTSGFGWSTRSNLQGGTSILFSTAASNQVTAATKSLVSGAANYTWFAWVKPTTSITANRYIWGERPVTGNWMSRLSLISTASGVTTSFPFGSVVGGLIFTVRDDAGNLTQFGSTDALNDGNWHFVAGVRNNTQAAVYWSLGQALKGSGYGNFIAATGTTTSSAAILSLGYDAANAGITFDGAISEAGLFLQALSSDQILALFLESQQGYPNLLNWRELETVQNLVPANLRMTQEAVRVLVQPTDMNLRLTQLAIRLLVANPPAPSFSSTVFSSTTLSSTLGPSYASSPAPSPTSPAASPAPSVPSGPSQPSAAPSPSKASQALPSPGVPGLFRIKLFTENGAFVDRVDVPWPIPPLLLYKGVYYVYSEWIYSRYVRATPLQVFDDSGQAPLSHVTFPEF